MCLICIVLWFNCCAHVSTYCFRGEDKRYPHQIKAECAGWHQRSHIPSRLPHTTRYTKTNIILGCIMSLFLWKIKYIVNIETSACQIMYTIRCQHVSDNLYMYVQLCVKTYALICRRYVWDFLSACATAQDRIKLHNMDRKPHMLLHMPTPCMCNYTLQNVRPHVTNYVWTCACLWHETCVFLKRNIWGIAYKWRNA